MVCTRCMPQSTHSFVRVVSVRVRDACACAGASSQRRAGAEAEKKLTLSQDEELKPTPVLTLMPLGALSSVWRMEPAS